MPPVVFSQAIWFAGGTGEASNLVETTNFGPRQCLDFDDQQWRYFSSANHTLAANGTNELEFTPDQVTGISAAVMNTGSFAPPYRISLQYNTFDDDGNVSTTNSADGIALFLGKDPTSYDTTLPPTGGTRGVIDDAIYRGLQSVAISDQTRPAQEALLTTKSKRVAHIHTNACSMPPRKAEPVLPTEAQLQAVAS